MVVSALRKIGLTEGEIRVYLALLELGSTSTGKLTKKSRISGSKVYEVLDRLIKKGLANYIVKNNVKYFEATSPEHLLYFLDEKKEDIEEGKKEVISIMPQLLLKQKSSNKSEVKIFLGLEGIKMVNEDIIMNTPQGSEWLAMGLTEQPKEWEIHFNKRQIIRAKRGVKHRCLVNEKYSSIAKFRNKLPYTEYRFFPKDLSMPTTIEIFNNKVALLILLKEAPMAILIENKAVHDSFKKYFEVMWKNSKK